MSLQPLSITKMGISKRGYLTASTIHMLGKKSTKTLMISLFHNLLLVWLRHHKKTNKWFQDSSPRLQTMHTLFKQPKACKKLSQPLLLNQSTERDGWTIPWTLWEQSGEEGENLMVPVLLAYLLKATWSSAAASSASLKHSFKIDIPSSFIGLKMKKRDSTLPT